jgi:hypothetical protein
MNDMMAVVGLRAPEFKGGLVEIRRVRGRGPAELVGQVEWVKETLHLGTEAMKVVFTDSDGKLRVVCLRANDHRLVKARAGRIRVARSRDQVVLVPAWHQRAILAIGRFATSN